MLGQEEENENRAQTNTYLVNLDGILFLDLSGLLPNPRTKVASTEPVGEAFHGQQPVAYGSSSFHLS